MGRFRRFLDGGWWNWRDPTPGKQLADMDVGLKVMGGCMGVLLVAALLTALGSC